MQNKITRRVAGWFLLLLCTLFALPALAQNKVRVTGSVVDTNGEPIIGASVIEKGTQNGAASDINGAFSINVGSNATLKVSFVGYETQEVKAKNGVKITLVENSSLLDEMVVVGYGVQKKANLTGAVASVGSKELQDIPAANAASLLQGRLPGVVLTSTSGQAGNNTPEIRIRGIGTLSDNNDPMVLIDGVEASVAQFSQLDASDIDNVSVLKDAASAAIYGVRAANGVILVTTKTGTESGKPNITYSGSFSLQKAATLPTYVGAYDWALMYNECRGTDFYTSDMLAKIQNGSDPDHFADTDWQSLIYRTAPMTQHNLSVNGGNKNVHYMISAGTTYQEGIIEKTDYHRYNLRSNIDAKLGIFKFGLNMSGSKEDMGEPGGITITGGDSVLRLLSWFTRPTVPVRYSNGYWAYQDGTSISQTVFKNPLQQMEDGHKTNDTYRFDSNIFAEVDLWKGLKFRSSLAYKLHINDTSSYSQRSKRYDADGNVVAETTTNSLSDYRWTDSTIANENILTYNNTFAKMHNVNLLLGHSTQQYRSDTDTGSIQNFATDNLYELNAGTENPSVSGSAAEYSLQSFFGRVGYVYGDKYLFEFNIRHDGSSRMPKSHRYATFPSVSAGWVITQESFIPESVTENVMPYLKIRGSWGKLGNQEIGNYMYSPTMAASYNYYFGNTKTIGMAENIVANDDIKWETTTMTDFGLDAAFWGSRINVTFDWYNKETSDILLQLSMPKTYLGSLSAPYQNAGKVRNRGWELSATYNDGRGDWHWNAGFQLAGVSNKITDYAGLEETISGNTINREGEAINSYYGLNALGIYRTQEDLTKYPQTVNGLEPTLGDIIYEDVDGNGNINADDRIIIGNPFPKLTYSFNLGFSWKNLDFTTFWQGVAGVYRYNWNQTTISNGGNMVDRWLDRWSSTNTGGSMPRLGNANNDEYSSFWLEKADYLRLKNIELGYTLRGDLFRKVGIQSARIYLQSTNMLTFTSYHDFDPEKAASDSRGDNHPVTKSFSVGVNVKF